MATFSGLLGLDVEDLVFYDGPVSPTQVRLEGQLLCLPEHKYGFYDPNNRDKTYGVIYYGSTECVGNQAEVDGWYEVQDVLNQLTVPKGAKVAYWDALQLAPDARRAGLGTKLVAHTLKYLKERGVGCVVLLANRSRGFWSRQGFVIPEFYEDVNPAGLDQPVMVRCGP